MICWESLKKLDEPQKEFTDEWGKLYEDLKDAAGKQAYQEDFTIKDFPNNIKKILTEMVNDCLDNTYILTENNKYTKDNKKQLFYYLHGMRHCIDMVAQHYCDSKIKEKIDWIDYYIKEQEKIL